jgi:hypothetical protein
VEDRCVLLFIIHPSRSVSPLIPLPLFHPASASFPVCFLFSFVGWGGGGEYIGVLTAGGRASVESGLRVNPWLGGRILLIYMLTYVCSFHAGETEAETRRLEIVGVLLRYALSVRHLFLPFTHSPVYPARIPPWLAGVHSD